MMRELRATVSPGCSVQMLVIVDCHARERRHRLALRSGDHHGHLLGRHLHDVLRPQQDRIGNGEQAEIMRDLGHVQHAAPEKRNLAPVLARQIQNLLQTMDRTAETGDDQPLLAA